MNSSKVTHLVKKKASQPMWSEGLQIMDPSREHRQRAHPDATFEVPPTVPCSPARGNLAPHIHLHGQHTGGA